MKKKKCLSYVKQLVLILTAMLTLISAVPLQFTATAANHTVIMTDADGYGLTRSIEIADGKKMLSGDHWCIITDSSGNGLYCLEPGKAITTSVYSESSMTGAMLQYEEMLGRVFLYAFTGKPDSTTTYQQYIATQMLVWEVLAGQRDDNFNQVKNGYTPVKDAFGSFQSTAASNAVKAYYDQYEANIKAHSKNITFAEQYKNIALKNPPTSNADGTYTFTDKNSQLGNFDITVTNGKVVTKTNSQLTISAEPNKTAVISLVQNNANASGERTGMLILGASGSQTVTALQADPREYYAAVKGVENGTLKLRKTAPDGEVANVSFRITGNSFSKTVKTDSKGYISIPELKPGAYTVEELNVPSKYNTPGKKTVTVTAGETTEFNFANTLKLGTVIVQKSAEDGQVENIKFNLSSYLDDGTLYGSYFDEVTTETGRVMWTNLPLYSTDGKLLVYKVSETGCPDRYIQPKPQSSILSSLDPPTAEMKFENILKRSDVLIVKTDGETGKTIPAAGTGFMILKDGKPVSLTDSDGNTADTFYTDESGQIQLPEQLTYGSYQLVEVKAPDGYVLDSEPVDFSVTENGAEVTVQKNNTAQKGTITISKTGEIFSHVSHDGVYTPEFEEGFLSGAEFDIIAAENIYTPDGTLRTEKGTVVDSVVTGSDGKAVSSELYLGAYSIVETKAPEGYVSETGEQLVVLEYAGQNVEVTNQGTSFANNYQQVNITLSKYFEKSDKYGAGSGNEYRHVSFGLYAAKKITAADGSSIPAGGLIETIYISEDLTSKFNTKLPFGSYYAQEITTDEKYILDDKKYPVEFAYSGEDTAVQEIEVNNGSAIENALKKGEIQGIKTDADSGAGLGNALIGIFFNDETDFTEDNAIETVTTNKDGSFAFNDVVCGQYFIKEIKAPTGYVLTDTSFPVTISEDGEVIEIEIENEKIRGSVRVEKYDFNDKDKKLSGAVFEVYTADNDFYGYLNETETGIYQLDGIEYGDYYLKETKAPEGHVIDNKSYSFSITEQGEVIIISNDKSSGKFYNDVIRGNINGKKLNADDKTGLGGALIGLFSEDETEFTEKNAIDTVTSGKDGSFAFEDIIYGKYQVAEIKAPEGFIFTEKAFPVSINVNGMIINITIENAPVKGNVILTKTGDVNPPELLSGAEFTIYKDVNKDGKYDESTDTAVGTLSETSKGIYEYKDLFYGDYILKETKAPVGYNTDDNYYSFSIRSSGESIIIRNTEQDGDNTFINLIIKGNVRVEKYDSSNKEKSLSGAVFEVFFDKDSDGKYNEETDESAGILTETESGIYELKDLIYGDYLLKEISAPEGYETDENYYSFSIRNNGETVVIGNNESDDKFYNSPVITTTTTTVTTTTTTTKASELPAKVTKATTSNIPFVSAPRSGSPKTGGRGISSIFVIGGLLSAAAIAVTAKRRDRFDK